MSNKDQKKKKQKKDQQATITSRQTKILKVIMDSWKKGKQILYLKENLQSQERAAGSFLLSIY